MANPTKRKSSFGGSSDLALKNVIER